MNIDEEIKAKKLKIAKELEELEIMKKIQEKFPDVEVQTARWGRKRYVSPSVNTLADMVEIAHNCGCCDDSPIELSAYLEIDGITIFAKPAFIYIGQKNKYGYGESPDINWKEILQKHKLSHLVIQKVQDYFDENSETYDDEDNE